MGLANDYWSRNARRALGVEVRGVQYLELRKTGIHVLINVQAREPNMEKVEHAIIEEWGIETLGALLRARELMLTERTRRDMIIPCHDTQDPTIPLSCVSLLHVLMQPEERLKSNWQFQLNVYARSIHVDKFEKDLELLKDVVAWLLEPYEEFYWEDYDPVISMHIASYHKELAR